MAISGPGKRVPKYGDNPVADLFNMGVGAAAIVLPGAMCARNAAGYAVKFSTALGLRCIGRFEGLSSGDNSAGAAGAISITIRRGVFRLVNSSGAGALGLADLGKFAYAVDDETVSRDPLHGTRSIMGTVVGFEAGEVWVYVGGDECETRFEYRWAAGADLRTKQYLYVKLDANDKLVLGGAGDDCVGILQNAPNTNEEGVVCFYGPTRSIPGGAVTKGASVASDAAGKSKAAVKGILSALTTTAIATADGSDAGTTQTLANAIKGKFNDLLLDLATHGLSGSYVMGDAMETGVLDTEFSVFLRPRGLAPTTAA